MSALLVVNLVGCQGGLSEGETSGEPPIGTQVLSANFNPEAAQGIEGAQIDASSLAEGFVSAQASNPSRLKFVITKDEASYQYDMINDTPITCPLNMGNGNYSFSVMQNTTGNLYVELYQETHDVQMQSEFEPFIRPNAFANYTVESACVAKAAELCADAQNQGDVVKNIYTWIVDNIGYDTAKATELSEVTGYVPDPDRTLSEGEGICFDYASLAAAMFRSQGIPCKIITGYVSSDTIYHAWNMVYIDGTWKSLYFTVNSGSWTLLDTTFAATGGNEFVGDGNDYTDRYVY